MAKLESDKSLARAVNLSFRFICLLLSAIILLSIVGYVLVIIQAIWAKDLRSEVDQLADTNQKLEENNRRFKESNGRLEKEVVRLEEEVEELNKQITKFQTLNDYLKEDLNSLEDNKNELQGTVTNMTQEGENLQNDIDSFEKKASDLTRQVDDLNSTAIRLKKELNEFETLEANLGSLTNASQESFNTILNVTTATYNEVVDIVLASTDNLLSAMADNLEFSDASAGFSKKEYNTWISYIALVLPQTEQQLLAEYPYRSRAEDITEIIKDIIVKQSQELHQVIESMSLPQLSKDTLQEGDVEYLRLRRTMLFTI